MTTTEAALRDLTASLVLAITPSVMSGSKFIEHKYDGQPDLPEWAESTPDSCLRRFSVRDTFAPYDPETSNTDVDWRVVELELIVAYPRTNRPGSVRKMDEAIRSDRTLLEKNVGLLGASNYSTVAAFLKDRASSRVDVGNQVSLLRMILPYGFFRSMP